MRYIDVTWHHDMTDEPVRLVSELDDSGYETRKVEIYADARHDFADGDHSTGNTHLAERQVPDDDVIAVDPQFSLRPMTPAEFEVLWLEAARRTR